MTYNEAIQAIWELFGQIGWVICLDDIFKDDCRNALLHRLADDAYSEWISAIVFLEWLSSDRGCLPSSITLEQLKTAFPDTSFRDNPSNGLEYLRGRLFTFSEYQLCKEAIRALSGDTFAENS